MYDFVIHTAIGNVWLDKHKSIAMENGIEQLMYGGVCVYGHKCACDYPLSIVWLSFVYDISRVEQPLISNIYINICFFIFWFENEQKNTHTPNSTIQAKKRESGGVKSHK